MKLRVELREPGRANLDIGCAKLCRFPLWTRQADDTGPKTWHWDGNVERPTITPSIDCTVCKRHFVVTEGVASGQTEPA